MEDTAGLERALEVARSGGSDGFNRLYEHHARQVAGFARAQGSEDPDGVVNEVFLAAFRSLPTFEGEAGGFRALLFTIARRRIADERRTRGRRPALAGHEIPELPGGDVEHEALAAAGDERVAKLLDLLTPDQREVLALRVIADLSLAEVAAVTERPIGAVKALQHRAVEALRRHFAAEPVSN